MKIVKRLLLGVVLLLFIGVAAFLVLAALPVPAPLAATPTLRPVVVSNVGIVDLQQGIVLPGRTVVIADGRINAVHEDDTATPPENAETIDGTGRFLIPGLWDMHAHHGSELSPQLTMPLFIAAGVTRIRDLGGGASLQQKREWNTQIREGRLLGPRVMGQAGRIIASLPGVDAVGNLVASTDPRDEFLKVYNQVLPEPYFALLQSAKTKGVSVVGHRPRSVAAIDAARAGHRSFEHARLFLFESFPGAAALRQRYLARYTGQDSNSGSLESTDLRRAMIDEYDSEMFDAVVTAMIESGTWFCPTHITRKMDAFADDSTYRHDPRLKYIHFLQQVGWNLEADGMVGRDPSPRGRKAFMDFYRKGLELTGLAHQAGVKVLAGSDATDTYSFPGFGLHDELKELVQAGLTPLETLRTATLNPAEYFGLGSDYSSIAAGKVADLVVLDANPLSDISNSTSIHAVIYDGNVYRRDDLDNILDYVEKNASSWRIAARIIWP